MDAQSSRESNIAGEKGNLRKVLAEVHDSTDLTNSYQLSIPLLVSAQLGDQDLYRKVKTRMFQNLELSDGLKTDELLSKWGQKASFNLWLLGRVLVSADQIKDEPTRSQVAFWMQEALEAQETVDAFSAWAWGYLAADAKRYPYCLGKMLDATAALKTQAGEKEKDNVQWALVMDLLAAGNAGDFATYQKLMEEFKDWVNKPSISEAVMTIPPQGFTAWALALVRVAAAQLGDSETCSEIQVALQEAIQKSPSKEDQLLAKINDLQAEQFISG